MKALKSAQSGEINQLSKISDHKENWYVKGSYFLLVRCKND